MLGSLLARYRISPTRNDICTSKIGLRPSVFYTFDLEMCFALHRRALFRHHNFQKCSYPGVLCTFWLGHVLCATPTCTFSATSKSAPTLVFFVHFDLEIYFAPQRRALFRHHNFQKWSEHGVLCAFWLRNVLRATKACTFSPSFQKCSGPGVLCTFWLGNLLRGTFACTFLTTQRCALYILTCKCVSRHNGVQLFISHLARWLRTRRFSKPTFRPSGATNHWKNNVSRLSCLFAHLHLLSSHSFSSLIFSLLLFSSLTLPTSAFSPLWLFPPLLFHLSILSEVWLLNFLRINACGCTNNIMDKTVDKFIWVANLSLPNWLNANPFYTIVYCAKICWNENRRVPGTHWETCGSLNTQPSWENKYLATTLILSIYLNHFSSKTHWTSTQISTVFRLSHRLTSRARIAREISWTITISFGFHTSSDRLLNIMMRWWYNGMSWDPQPTWHFNIGYDTFG